MIKRFKEWFGVKEKVGNRKILPPYFKEGEIWWCYVGENVGVEINGKGNEFTRPVLILKKFNQYSFLGLPLTTQNKIGRYYKEIFFKGKKQIAVLSQGRSFDFRRLKEFIASMHRNEFMRLRKEFLDFLQK